jgi:hypothetical protein
MDWLTRLFKDREQKEGGEISTDSGASGQPSGGNAAQAYLEKVHKKIDALASDFAKGMINRSQFQELYSHYQREMSQVEQILKTQPEAWESAATEGQSLIIRKEHMARAQAYAIYVNESGIPLGTLGKFNLDPALVVPMLSSYRSATNEIFGSSLRLSQIGEDQWLCFVSGQYTTLLAIFTNEPIVKQLEYLNDLHRDFETANQPVLTAPMIDVDKLIYPHEYFLGKWRR